MSDSKSNERPGDSSNEIDRDVAQRFDRSFDFWIDGREDYPPAIRGAMADVDDLPNLAHSFIQQMARDSSFPNLKLKRLLWFEDKNDKLDEACEEGKRLFAPFAVNADGLIATSPDTNPFLEQPTRHRLVVSEKFARENYDRQSEDDVFIEEPKPTEETIGPKSWKRKMTQTLKPWSVRRNGRLEHLRPEDDLTLTLNQLFSRTKHGWLVVDMTKLRQRRGAMLTYARTFEYQRIRSQLFEFKIELFGVSKELVSRFDTPLNNLGCLYLDIDDKGRIYVTKASVYADAISPSPPSSSQPQSQPQRKAIHLSAKVALESGSPSQLVLVDSGEFYESQLRPLIEPGKRSSHKLDLRKLSGDEAARFCLSIEVEAPLLIATSGDAVLFQLDDLLTRFAGSNLETIRASKDL